MNDASTAAETTTTRTERSDTTTVDLVIRLQVKGALADVARYRAALECLAEVMVVQAEDGLWSAGHPDSELNGAPSTFVAGIESACVGAVLIEGRDELTTQISAARSSSEVSLISAQGCFAVTEMFPSLSPCAILMSWIPERDPEKLRKTPLPIYAGYEVMGGRMRAHNPIEYLCTLLPSDGHDLGDEDRR